MSAYTTASDNSAVVALPRATVPQPLTPLIDTGESFTVTGTSVTDLRTAGGTTFFNLQVNFINTGALSGPSVAHLQCVVPATGRGRCQGPEYFTGTVAGRTGTAVFHDELSLVGDTVQGRYVIVSGTGGLATLRGEGTFQGVGSTGTYTLRMQFAP